eukprot:TRINITY_DN4729_c0_g1_i1.p1 TRINITY_DN4729_c0_g1~~TRINITY_DN4729_c0_g1_i1.p1  ORF type:complete len:145 (-),score=35.77 TRINITY_DN4729_c0_g1_i1:124-558(-)
MAGILFEDMFDIKDKDRDGKKFEKVSRIFGNSENYEMELILDVNSDIYPLEINNKVYFTLASTTNTDGTPEEGYFDQSGKQSLMDQFEYVMFGRVFKITEEKGQSQKVSIFASFGGLLMMLKGDPRHLHGIDLDARIYLLMRRV